jgi:hypothetical protein
MRTVEGQVLASLRATQTFLDERAESIPGVAGTSVRRRMDAAIADLARLIADQEASALQGRGTTQRLRALRRVLVRDHLRPLSQIAREAELALPELAPFRMPRGRPSVERLAATARGMALAAEPYTALFVDAGLREGFLDRLVAAADAMIDAVGERAVHRVERHRATVGIRVALLQSRRAVRVFDSLVASAWADEPGLLAAWRSAKRVRRVPARRSAEPVVAVAMDRAVAIPMKVRTDLFHRFGAALRSTDRQPAANYA